MAKMTVGTEMRPLIEILAQNPVLTELDITGNKIGDQMGVSLSDCLRKNNHLKSLSWDQNNVSIGGWQAMVNCLSQNRTLVHCPVPRSDMEKAVKESKNKDVFATRVKECMENLQAAVKQNLGGQGTTYISQYEKSKKARTYTVRPAYMTLRPGQIQPGTFSQNSGEIPPIDTGYRGSPRTSEASIPLPVRRNFVDEIPQNNNEPYYETYQEDYSAPPPPEETEFGYDKAHSYENDYAQEYDDSAYDDSAYEAVAPPPPPPPPF